MNIKLTAVFQKVPEGYIGFVEELPGANTQGNTLEEAVTLVLEANRELAEESLKGKEVQDLRKSPSDCKSQAAVATTGGTPRQFAYAGKPVHRNWLRNALPRLYRRSPPPRTKSKFGLQPAKAGFECNSRDF